MLPLLLCFLAVGLSTAMPNEDRQRFLNYMKNSGQLLDEDIMEDATLSVMELISKYGYQGEEHKIQTADGYKLTVHRILPKSGCGTTKPIPVILQHGLLSSSFDWIVMGPGKGLGYILADECFDVWMGNSRGNTHSREHVSLDPSSNEFWDFSWHEMGINDIPSVIDYILYRTGSQKVFYVGHSQGTTQYFVMDSMKPEYSSKVAAMFALAPVAFMGNSESTILKTIAHFQGVAGWIASTLGINEFLPSNDFISSVGGKLCNDEHPNSQKLCENALFAICGYDEEQTNATMLPVILAHTPAGSATKQFLHYAQLMNTGKFQMYDYGSSGNKEHYGQKDPPEYPLGSAQSTYLLVYSLNDFFANVKDVDTLYTNLKRPLGKILVPWEKFNHLDYLWAIDAKTYVYDKVLDIMNSDTF